MKKSAALAALAVLSLGNNSAREGESFECLEISNSLHFGWTYDPNMFGSSHRPCGRKSDRKRNRKNRWS